MTSAADVAALLHMLGGFAYTGGLFGFPLCAFILCLALGALTAECCGVALIVPALALLVLQLIVICLGSSQLRLLLRSRFLCLLLTHCGLICWPLFS